jgi:hypothetical protein
MTQNAKTQDWTSILKRIMANSFNQCSPTLHLAKKHNKSNELENCCSKPIYQMAEYNLETLTNLGIQVGLMG